uniref:RNase H type-1 domain-containing protein n=1 Tax=Fagus sylvatica TaxID=28930 RepID=A0A2N9F8Q9_FAGSY
MPENGVWQQIWSLNIPPKIRHFLWRAYRESLPTKKNLQSRHIPVDPCCSECLNADEDAIHSIWGCQVLTPLWAKTGHFHALQALQFSSFGELLKEVLNKLDEHHQLIFAVQAWLVWFRRNKGRVENQWDDLDSLGIRASIVIQDHLLHHSKSESTTLPSPITHWQPPDRGTWKINFDGAMRKDIGAAGVGVVVRNHQGHTVATYTERFHLPQTPAIIEALAARAAVHLALELKLDQVSFEGDSEIIIKALQSIEANFTSYGHIIEETQDKSKFLQSCSFQHTRHSANNVAH